MANQLSAVLALAAAAAVAFGLGPPPPTDVDPCYKSFNLNKLADGRVQNFGGGMKKIAGSTSEQWTVTFNQPTVVDSAVLFLSSAMNNGEMRRKKRLSYHPDSVRVRGYLDGTLIFRDVLSGYDSADPQPIAQYAVDKLEFIKMGGDVGTGPNEGWASVALRVCDDASPVNECVTTVPFDDLNGNASLGDGIEYTTEERTTPDGDSTHTVTFTPPRAIDGVYTGVYGDVIFHKANGATTTKTNDVGAVGKVLAINGNIAKIEFGTGQWGLDNGHFSILGCKDDDNNDGNSCNNSNPCGDNEICVRRSSGPGKRCVCEAGFARYVETNTCAEMVCHC